MNNPLKNLDTPQLIHILNSISGGMELVGTTFKDVDEMVSAANANLTAALLSVVNMFAYQIKLKVYADHLTFAAKWLTALLSKPTTSVMKLKLKATAA